MIENLIDCQIDMLYNLILIIRDIQKMKIKFFISTLLVSFQALIAEPTLEDQVKAAKNPDYYIHVAYLCIICSVYGQWLSS